MNTNRKYVLFIVMLVIVIQLLFFVPYSGTYQTSPLKNRPSRTIYINEHGSIFSSTSRSAYINVGQFFIYWAIIGVFGGLTFYLVKDEKEKKDDKEKKKDSIY